MPNPRKQIGFQEIDVRRETYAIDGVTILFDATKPGGSVSAGVKLAVSLSAPNTVQLCNDGEGIVGRLEKVERDGFCTVETGGHLDFQGGLAAALTRGKAIVGATGAAGARGYVREVNTAVAAEGGVARGQIQSAADPTAVHVLLD